VATSSGLREARSSSNRARPVLRSSSRPLSTTCLNVSTPGGSVTFGGSQTMACSAPSMRRHMRSAARSTKVIVSLTALEENGAFDLSLALRTLFAEELPVDYGVSPSLGPEED